MEKSQVKKIIKEKRLNKSIRELEKNKYLLTQTKEEVKQNIINELEVKIEEYGKQLKNEKDDEISSKKKKYLREKIRKAKKTLSCDNDINYLVSMKRKSLRKLKSKKEKLTEIILKEKKKNLICFKCRGKGHLINDCTFEEDAIENNNGKISAFCFNCGSNDHSVHTCKLPVDYSNMPYATCFTCGEKGHLYSKCPKSETGIFPDGGFCYVCKKKDHLAKNCPEKKLQIIRKEEEYKNKKNYKKK